MYKLSVTSKHKIESYPDSRNVTLFVPILAHSTAIIFGSFDLLMFPKFMNGRDFTSYAFTKKITSPIVSFVSSINQVDFSLRMRNNSLVIKRLKSLRIVSSLVALMLSVFVLKLASDYVGIHIVVSHYTVLLLIIITPFANANLLKRIAISKTAVFRLVCLEILMIIILYKILVLSNCEFVFLLIRELLIILI